MPGLTTTLLTAANALTVFDRALATSQNNVANVDTPGYARQRFQTVALPFQPETGLPGGITAGELASARQEFAEQAVRRQLSQWGWSQASAAGLGQVEPLFDARGETGIPAALSRLFQSFSSLSIASNDPVARQAVIGRAGELAARFNETLPLCRRRGVRWIPTCAPLSPR